MSIKIIATFLSDTKRFSNVNVSFRSSLLWEIKVASNHIETFSYPSTVQFFHCKTELEAAVNLLTLLYIIPTGMSITSILARILSEKSNQTLSGAMENNWRCSFKYWLCAAVHPQNVRFHYVRFQNVQYVQPTKCPVFKTSCFKNLLYFNTIMKV